MARIAINFWLWMPATVKALLFCIVTCGAAFLAATNDMNQVSEWTYFQWCRLWVIVGCAGLNTIIAFLDQTIQVIRNKVGDTELFMREGPR
jgi:diphthamide synthase subunit DPH2